MWQEMDSFTKYIISYKSSFKSSTLSDSLPQPNQGQIEGAAKHLSNGEQTDNDQLKKLFTSIKGHSSSVGFK